MKKAIIAKKVGMTQIFSEKGTLIPVTVLEAGPCLVVQKKTMEKDGYEALQVGYGDVKTGKVNKPSMGHYKARLGQANATPCKLLKEIKIDGIDTYEIGSFIKADVFSEGDQVDVTGISKGKGFQGNIKRHGMHRGPMSHGSKYHRGVGAMSACATPGRVVKGRKMPGHMGAERVTVKNLKIMRSDAEKNLILIQGSVPGPRGTIIIVKSTTKSKKSS